MSEPLVKNAADEAEVKEAGQKSKLAKDTEKNQLRALLRQKEFRRFIYPYVKRCDKISADPSGSWTYFNEGERNVCQKIKASLIEADDESVLLMMKEGKDNFK